MMVMMLLLLMMIIIISSFLCRYSKWSITLKHERILSVFENRVINLREMK